MLLRDTRFIDGTKEEKYSLVESLVEQRLLRRCGTFISVTYRLYRYRLANHETQTPPASLFNNKLSDASIDHEHTPSTKLNCVPISVLYCNVLSFCNDSFSRKYGE